MFPRPRYKHDVRHNAFRRDAYKRTKRTPYNKGRGLTHPRTQTRQWREKKANWRGGRLETAAQGKARWQASAKKISADTTISIERMYPKYFNERGDMNVLTYLEDVLPQLDTRSHDENVACENAYEYFLEGYICPWTLLNYYLSNSRFELDAYKPNLIHAIKFHRGNWEGLFTHDMIKDLFLDDEVKELQDMKNKHKLNAQELRLHKWWIEEDKDKPPMLADDFIYTEDDILSCATYGITPTEYMDTVSAAPLTDLQARAVMKEAQFSSNVKNVQIIRLRQKPLKERAIAAKRAWEAQYAANVKIQPFAAETDEPDAKRAQRSDTPVYEGEEGMDLDEDDIIN